MKRIVYLSYFFEPDLSACSFRNSSLANQLALQAKSSDVMIDLYTTLPNRYNNYKLKASSFEKKNNLNIHRISLPSFKKWNFWTNSFVCKVLCRGYKFK